MRIRSIAPAAAISLLASSLTLVVATPAESSSSFGIDYYVSKPFVPNTYIDLDAPTTYLEDFDDNLCTGGSNGLVDSPPTVSWTAAAVCQIEEANQYGGALSTTSSQIVGNMAGALPSTFSRPANGPITVSFSVPMKYVGFWWSAGSGGNRIDFYKSGQNVLTLTTAEIFNLFGEGKPDAVNRPITSSIKLTFPDSSEFPKGYYFGNPASHTSLTPTTATGANSAYNEPFTYLHLFANGSFDFDQVVLSGGGFEFDNFVASSVAQTPSTALYKVGSAYPTVGFNNNGGSGTMASQSSGVSAPLSANTFLRTGYRFIGWNTQADGQGTTYSDEAVFNFLSSLTLYAQWAPNYIEFDPNGGSGSILTQSSSVSGTLSANAFQRSGFQFTGWNTRADGQGVAFANEAGFAFTYSVRLYAIWQAVAPATPPSYRGPLLTCNPIAVATPTLGAAYEFSGSRLNTITSGSVDGKPITIVSKSNSSLVIGLPELAVGNYEIIFESSEGKVTVGNCLTIISRAPATNPTSSSTVSPVTESPEAAKKTYTVTKRFYTFIGDKGQLVPRDVRAIQIWLAGLEGITSVTCMGSTSGVPAVKTDPALARTRARNACNLVAKIVPDASIRTSFVTGRGVGQFFRAVQITVRGEVQD